MYKKMFFIFFFMLSVLFFSGCERTGVINIDDCRETITVEDNSIQTYFKNFTCSYEKTKNGQIISGYCASVKLNNSGKCDIAYTYNKEPAIKCIENSHLSYDGLCHCNFGYILSASECIDVNINCQNEYGNYSTYNNETHSCKCNGGYILDNNKKCSLASSVCIAMYGYAGYYSILYDSCICKPFSGYTIKDGKCVCADNTISYGNDCLSYSKYCQLYYGENVFGKMGKDNIVTCYCDDGYYWNENETNCIK